MTQRKSSRLPLRYPIWAWHQARPEQLAARRWGRFPLGAEARRRKNAAVRCYASQLSGQGSGGAIVSEHVLRYFQRPYEAFLL